MICQYCKKSKTLESERRVGIYIEYTSFCPNCGKGGTYIVEYDKIRPDDRKLFEWGLKVD